MSTAVPTRGASRLVGVDTVRGTAVLLVLIGHAYALVWTFHQEVGGAPLPPNALTWLSEGLRPLRMPVLLAISGFWLDAALRQPLTGYAERRVRAVLWPFLVWTALTALAYHPGVRTPDPKELATGFLHMWFFVILMFCAVIGPLARVVSPWVLALVMGGITFALDPATMGTVRTVFFWSFFYFVGAGLGRHVDRLRGDAWRPIILLLGLATLGVCLATGWAAAHQQTSPLFDDLLSFHPDRAIGLLLGLPGVLFFLTALPRIPRIPGVTAAGENSVVVYTSHVAVIFLVTRAWVALGLPASLWLSVVAGAVAVVVCALLIRYRHRVEWLFTPPWPPLVRR